MTMPTLSRRRLFRRGAIAAGAVAVAPSLLASPAGAQSLPFEGLTVVPDWARTHNRPGIGNFVTEFFRVIPRPSTSAGHAARVLAYNGAALVRKDGEAFGIPYMDVTGLAFPVVGIAAMNDIHRIALLLEDGDCVLVGTSH